MIGAALAPAAAADPGPAAGGVQQGGAAGRHEAAGAGAGGRARPARGGLHQQRGHHPGATQSHRPPSGRHNLTLSPAGALPGRQGEWSQSPGGAALHLPLL